MNRLFALALAAALCACGSSHEDDVAPDSSVTPNDGGPADGGDASTLPDAGDSGTRADSGDSGTRPDGETPVPPDNHRPAADVCPTDRETLPFDPPSGEEPLVECRAHADCVAGDNGRCSWGRGGPFCSYDGCFTDDECGTTDSPGVCRCGTDIANYCMVGNCQIDADCGQDGFCSPTLGSCGNYFGPVAYFCHTPEDECVNDSECVDQAGGYCAFDELQDHWTCQYGHCVG